MKLFLTGVWPGAVAAAICASQICSLTVIRSRTRSRKRWYSVTCWRVRSTAAPLGITRVTVLPATAWVNE